MFLSLKLINKRVKCMYIYIDTGRRGAKFEHVELRIMSVVEDNRHNLLRTCVTRVTYIFTAGQITVGS